MSTIRRFCISVAIGASFATPELAAAHGGHLGPHEGLLGAFHFAPSGMTLLVGVAAGLVAVGVSEFARRRPRG